MVIEELSTTETDICIAFLFFFFVYEKNDYDISCKFCLKTLDTKIEFTYS